MAAISAPLRFPLSFNKYVCTRLSPVFREAVELKRTQLTAADVSSNDVVVRNRFVGINASDINFTAGMDASMFVVLSCLYTELKLLNSYLIIIHAVSLVLFRTIFQRS